MFYIDIEDASGNRLGGGPITSAASWQYTARVDKAGGFAFEMPASDPKAALVQRKRKARAWALINNQWAEVGAGIIDHIERRVGTNGETSLLVSGDDELRELAGRSVGWLDLSGGGGGLWHTAAVAMLSWSAAAPMGWTVLPATGATNDIYARFAGESVLAAMAAIAEKTQTHFYRSGPRAATFLSAFELSGLRAVRAGGGDLAAETCAIVDLAETIETFDLLTRIVPLGAGNGETRLTLAATTRTAPAGYTLDKAANYLQYDAAVAEFGIIDAPWIEFKDVRPVSNTDADLQAAANMLFDQALKELKRRAIDMHVAAYQVKLAGCSKLLRPLQSLRLVYRDLDAGIDVDRDVNILAATWTVNTDGVQTTALELSTGDLWPQNDTAAIAERIMEGSVYQAHPQLNANAYVVAYTKHLDDNQLNPAQFRFRFDQEVTQLTRACFDFQLLPLESTVKSVASNTATSSAGGATTATSTSTTDTPGTSSAGGGTTVTSASTTDSAQTSSSGGGTTVTSASTTDSAQTSSSGGGTTVTSASGGAASVTSQSGDKSHLHTVTLLDGQPGQLVFYSGGALYSPTGGTRTVNSNFANVPHDHTVNVPDHSHSVTVGNHSHTVTIPGHSHSVTVGNHSHTVTIPGHSHSVTVGNHSHTVTIPGHSHGVTIPSHTHTVTPTITMEYGVFRDSAGNVFALGDLEYSLDGATWYYFIPGVNGYASLGGGWHRIDITSLVQNQATLRPASSNNLLQVRRKLTGTTGKKCTIDAQMSIRTIIQAIAFTT